MENSPILTSLVQQSLSTFGWHTSVPSHVFQVDQLPPPSPFTRSCPEWLSVIQRSEVIPQWNTFQNDDKVKISVPDFIRKIKNTANKVLLKLVYLYYDCLNVMRNNVKKQRILRTSTQNFFKFFAFNLNLLEKNGKVTVRMSTVDRSTSCNLTIL